MIMAFSAGSQLGSYEILALAGAGGMGEVYVAKDTNLSRKVALKVLPPAMESPERLKRFEREAKTVAALNHPNIVHVYSVEESEGVHFITMELVQGKTLTELIPKSGMSLKQFFEIAIPLADALSAAHERGIIHRDLKPDNLMVGDDGRLKVLDFGLAKLKQEFAQSGLSELPTRSVTQEGRIVGTVAYMSPEQAEGKNLDHRSDIFSMGIILYLMATGRSPFRGDTATSVLSSIIKDTPPSVTEVNPVLPNLLGRIIRRCQVKDPERRFQTAKDLRNELEELKHDVDSGVVLGEAVPAPAKRSAIPWTMIAVVAAVVAVMFGGLAVWWPSRTVPPASQSTRRFAVTLPGLVTDTPSFLLTLSRDGRTLVYRHTSEGSDMLYRRSMDALEVSPIRDTEGAINPFLSPDGKWVGFFRQGELKKVSLAGGSSITVCDAPRWSAASWGPDDTIVFNNRSSGLSRVSANGGVPEPLTVVESEGEVHWSPHFLPGGKAVLFTSWSWTGPRRIMVLSLDTGEQRDLVGGTGFLDSTGPRFAGGHILFGRGQSLWAVPFDVNGLEIKGEPFLALEGIRVAMNMIPQFAVADDGTLVYVTSTGAVARKLVWVDRKGKEEPTTLPPAKYGTARLSPDGTRVAVTLEGDVWVAELARGTRTRVTTNPGLDILPSWTPDGKRVVFDSHREEPLLGLHWKAADGTGSAERLMSMEEDPGNSHWSPDGKTLVFFYWVKAQHIDIGVLSMEGERAWEPLIHTESNETAPALSPDGRWIAYASDETGQYEVYVQRFPGLGERRLISTGGGMQPTWSPDGKELFYRRWYDDAMMVVPIDTVSTLTVGDPAILFEGSYCRFGGFPFVRDYDIAPDGKRFLMIKDVRPPEEIPPPEQITVVLNWFQELERLVQ